MAPKDYHPHATARTRLPNPVIKYRNQFNTAYDESLLIEKLIGLIRELHGFPVSADLRIRARSDPDFPSHTVFRRLGRKAEIAQKLISFCESHDGYDDVIDICRPIISSTMPSVDSTDENLSPEPVMGFVYLMKSGAYHKLGRTNAVGRREYELAIQLPEKLTTVHKIKTDDPAGIEAYWHNRFADRRTNGEWFSLSPSDVAAFKRRTFM